MLHEDVEAVVMRPVAGAVDIDQPRILEVCDAPVDLGIGGPGFGAAHQQHGRGDAAPDAMLVFGGQPARPAAQPHGIVELPRIGAVLVLHRAVDGQMARLLIVEMGVLFFHARDGIFDARIFARGAARILAPVFDPAAQALFDAGLAHVA